MTPILKKIKKFIVSQNILDINSHILVGVSGGMDSVVLLDILIKLGYKCSIAHCNFHLRGIASDMDEKFTQQLAENHNINFFIKYFDTTQIAEKRGVSVEMAARELRYEWFEELIDRHKFSCIAVAHHKNDNAETIIMNLARGTGLKGLTGMQPKRDRIVRPLLCLDREEIEAYIKKNRLNYCIDATNDEVKFHRNRIRHNVIPELTHINPNFLSNINQFAKKMQEYHLLVEDIIEKEMKNIVVFGKDSTSIDVISLLENRFQNLILFEITKKLSLPASIIEEIKKLMRAETGKKLFFEDMIILKNREIIVIEKSNKKTSDTFEISDKMPNISTPIKLCFEVVDREEIGMLKCEKNIALLDYETLSFPLIVRQWQNGDRFKPLGMDNFQKISDFLTNQKIDVNSKQNCWVMLCDDKIIWLINQRIDNRFRVTAKTKKILRITYQKNRE